MEFLLRVKIEDDNYTNTIIKNNNVTIHQTTESEFELKKPLVSGDNEIEIHAYDDANNESMIKIYKITQTVDDFRLTNLSPNFEATTRGNELIISGKSTLPLSEVKINGQQANITADKLGYGIVIPQPTSGGGE